MYEYHALIWLGCLIAFFIVSQPKSSNTLSPAHI